MGLLKAGVLGPLELHSDGRIIAVEGRRQRALLAFLLLRAGNFVPVVALIAALWGQDPPETAVGQIQTAVWRLRCLLGRERQPWLMTRPGGYVLDLGPGWLDLVEFRSGVSAGHAKLAAGRMVEASQVLREALALWRGPAFGDISAPFAAQATASLAEERLAAIEDCVEAELQTGRHSELVPELHGLVGTHPQRDRLRCALMISLYRSGRQADALDVFREGHRILAREFGLSPSSGLRRVYEAILADDPSVDVREATILARPEPPRELPPDIADFTGREDALDVLHSHLRGGPPGPGDGPAARTVVISGPGGTGKTALAIHAAHMLQANFPDGQIFVNLHGLRERRMASGQVQARVLRRLNGDDFEVPDDADERTAAYRAGLADRRLLLILDDAESEGQVRALLPAGNGCAVLATGRRRLTALDSAAFLDLGTFDAAESLQLLRYGAGSERVAAEPEAADTIARLCGGLPLAIRIAGARLAGRPHWSLTRFARQLADERDRLDALVAGDREVRSSIELGRRSLSPLQDRLFRLLGLLPGSEFHAWTAGHLLDVEEARAEALLEELADARLVEIARCDPHGNVRYGLHDLVRLYARERADADEPMTSQVLALTRLLAAWLYLAEQAQGQLPGGITRIAAGTAPRRPPDDAVLRRVLADPMGWFDAEWQALSGAVDLAVTMELHEFAWDLACCLGRFLEVRGYFDECVKTYETALGAARSGGNARGEAHLLRGLGELWMDKDAYDESLRCLQAALAIFAETGERSAQAHVLRQIGVVRRMRGEPAAAVESLQVALQVFGSLDDLRGQADALYGLGAIYRERGQATEALDCYRQAVRLLRPLGDEFTVALVLCSMGSAHLATRQTEEAAVVLRESLDICRKINQRNGEAFALAYLGELHTVTGDVDTAEHHLRQAILICREINERYGEAIALRNLGELYLHQNDLRQAQASFEEALRVWDVLAIPLWRARTLRGLGDVAAAAGNLQLAYSHWKGAHVLFQSVDAPEADETDTLLARTVGPLEY